MAGTTELNGDWNIQKGKLKQKFAVLTDNDLAYEPGKQAEMLVRLQVILGKTKGDLRKIIEEL